MFGRKGKPHLLDRLPAYNRAARHEPRVIVMDLDHDAECAPAYLAQVLPSPSSQMYPRIAVRAIEAWLLADSERLAEFLGVSPALIPVNPDAEGDPKGTLVNLARRSQRRRVRDDTVPREGTRAVVGPGYSARLRQFVSDSERGWRPDVARQRSPSLERCMEAIAELARS